MQDLFSNVFRMAYFLCFGISPVESVVTLAFALSHILHDGRRIILLHVSPNVDI